MPEEGTGIHPCGPKRIADSSFPQRQNDEKVKGGGMEFWFFS